MGETMDGNRFVPAEPGGAAARRTAQAAFD